MADDEQEEEQESDLQPKLGAETEAKIKAVRAGCDLESVDMKEDRGSKAYTLVVEPWECVGCVPVSGASFLTKSSFVGPSAGKDLQELASAVAQVAPKAKAVLFGHSDLSGDSGANKTLSERRAKAVLALATMDVAAWESLDKEEEWGLDIVQTILQDLGHEPGPVDGKDGPKTQGAVKAFQTEKSLDVDGIAGPNTRKALYTEYMGKHGQKLKKEDAFLDPFTVAAGDTLPLYDVEGRFEPNRRVVAYFFTASRPPTIPQGDALKEFYGKIREHCSCETPQPPPPPRPARKSSDSEEGQADPPPPSNQESQQASSSGSPTV